jgi:hypothetical protein
MVERRRTCMRVRVTKAGKATISILVFVAGALVSGGTGCTGGGGSCDNVSGSWAVSGCASDTCSVTQTGCSIALSCGGGVATGSVSGSSVQFNGSETLNHACTGAVSGGTVSGTCATGVSTLTCMFAATLTGG